MFTDLNLTDMETCYKVFRREVIQSIDIKENRFGFEPEIVAKIAQMRLRIFEMGISYYGRTYAEGKKIGVKDGFRALYCIFRYNANKAPVPIQILIYFNIGAIAAVINLITFYLLIRLNVQIVLSAPIAFVTAAIVNYLLCIKILFRHKARWKSKTEIIIYLFVVLSVCLIDLDLTEFFLKLHMSPVISKLIASISVFILNFLGRRFIVFPEPRPGPWRPQNP
jgi:putative flippase GtrA